MTELSSFWCHGAIRHRRLAPVKHEFTYNLGMMALDLDDWERLNNVSRWFSTGRFNWITLSRDDYFEPERQDLKAAIADHVFDALGWRPDGRIELLTVPRYLGLLFNPVSFYFCYNTNDPQCTVPRAIVAQITNTPWLGRHSYCLDLGNPDETEVSSQGKEQISGQSNKQSGEPGWQTYRFNFAKRFHVSPFNALKQNYEWLFAFKGNDLRIHMNVSQDDGKTFDATLTLKKEPLTARSFSTFLRRFPLESFKIVSGIYWQALRLKLKGARFHSHPEAEDDIGAPDRNTDVTSSRNDPDTQINTTSTRSETGQRNSPGRVTSWRN